MIEQIKLGYMCNLLNGVTNISDLEKDIKKYELLEKYEICEVIKLAINEYDNI